MTSFQKAMNKLSAAWDEFAVKVGTPMMQDLALLISSVIVPAFEGWSAAIGETGDAANKSTEEQVKGLTGLAKWLGVVSDVIHSLGMAWKLFKFLWLKQIELMVDGVNLFVGSIIKGWNGVVGIFGRNDLKAGNFLDVLGEDMERANDKMWRELGEDFIAKTPSEKMKMAMEQIQREAKQGVKKIEETIDNNKIAEKLSGMTQAEAEARNFAKVDKQLDRLVELTNFDPKEKLKGLVDFFTAPGKLDFSKFNEGFSKVFREDQLKQARAAAEKNKVEFSGAAEFGTVAARETILRHQFGTSPDKTEKDQLKETQVHTRLLNSLLEAGKKTANAIGDAVTVKF